MFGGKKKLYAEGAQTQGVVVEAAPSKEAGYYWYTVRVKLPDGSTTDIRQPSDGFLLDEGQVVPCRYNPSDYSKVVVDVPVLKDKAKQVEAAQQAQYDAQLAHLGGPGSAGSGDPEGAQVIAALGDLGGLKEQLLQMAAEHPGAVIDLRQSQPPAQPASDPVEQLEKLAEMKKQGLLSDAEFAAAKTKLLGE